MTNKIRKKLQIVATLTLALALNASAVVVYDNSITDLETRVAVGLGTEVGDEITLTAGPERYLTDFSFEYYLLNGGSGIGTPVGTPLVTVSFYLNDGPLFNGYETPGTALWTSTPFALTTLTERQTLNFDASDFGGEPLFIPVDTFTWAVSISGLGAGDDFGLDVYGPVAVGSSFPDYWLNSGGSWSLLATDVPINFAAKFEAVVPEPSTAVIAILGGLGLFAVGRRMRKS
ncbi:MAG: PEP-CTERM sorting domain-containing protein [Verrucomicrobiae bacterium]|nr:PEP-CTERM sorting domain-containing protein [Verrucomicrobiae bacterium]